MKNKKAFTLLELLVVVLIIGILAAIALPQYQMAVGKARFSELKTLTKTFQQSVQRYYIIHNTYAGINDDIQVLDVELPSESKCSIIDSSLLRCCKKIFNTQMCFYMKSNTGKPFICTALSTNTNDLANRLCHKETDHSSSCITDQYCKYYY